MKTVLKQTKIHNDPLVAAGCPRSGWKVVLPIFGQFFKETVREEYSSWLREIFRESMQGEYVTNRDWSHADLGKEFHRWSLEQNQSFDAKLYADSRNTWLLDAWADHHPEARFALFYTEADIALAHALSEGSEWASFIEEWTAANKAILRFRHRHRDRSLLFEANSAVNSPAEFAEACCMIASHESYTAKRSPETHVKRPGALEHLLAKQLLSDSTEVYALQLELEASAVPLNSSPIASRFIDEVYNDYRQREITLNTLNNNLLQAKELETSYKSELYQAKKGNEQLEETIQESKQENELLHLQLDQTQDELKTVSLEKKSLEEALIQLTEENNTYRESAQRDTDLNNELLLLQLQQTQDEFEHYYQKYQEATMLPDTSLGKKDTLQADGSPNQKDMTEIEKPTNATTENTDSSSLIVLSNPFKSKKKKYKRSLRQKEQEQICLIRESGLFDEEWYLNEYPDVANEGLDPVKHYLRYGSGDERNPSPNFNTKYYLTSNPDVHDARINPLIHYIRFGREEGRRVS